MSLPDFNALTELHNSANNLLHSPEIQQVVFHQKQEKWVEQVCDASLRMLDVCGISKDVILLVKQHLLDLQLTLRGKILSQPNNNAKVAAYNHYSKKLKKETLKCLRSLKGMKNKSDDAPWAPSTSDILRMNYRNSSDDLRAAEIVNEVCNGAGGVRAEEAEITDHDVIAKKTLALGKALGFSFDKDDSAVLSMLMDILQHDSKKWNDSNRKG